MWKTWRLVGDNNWLDESIQAGACVTVTYDLYIRELSPELCSTAFVLECSEGRWRIIGSLPENSLSAYV